MNTPQTPDYPNGASQTPVEGNIKALAALFPSAVREGVVDFDALRQCLGEDAIGEESKLFGLQWHGKKEARAAVNIPSLGTLRPCPSESEKWDVTQNVYIEGDNLEVLKLLQKSYHGKVKMIYIDPPYNTGSEFVYTDNYKDSIQAYKELTLTGDFSANQESNGRYHTNWLNMMSPRLSLARELLTEDGVIFISIDDNEQANLLSLCKELFGEHNAVATIVWKRKRGRDNSARWFSKAHEYCLVFAKNKELLNLENLELDEETKKAYTNPDHDPRGVYRMLGCWARGTQGGVRYAYTSRSGQYFSERLWLFSLERLSQLDAEGKLIFRGANIYRKMFLWENKGKKPETLWTDISNAANAADEIKKIFGDIVFDTPKPLPYIKQMLALATQEDALILDFFSGSATTAHAVMQLNAEDGGKRRYIMVQLPESCPEDSEAAKAGYRTICDIGKARLRRAGAKIQEEHPEWQGDTGFRVYKLDSSNLKRWNPQISELREALPGFIDHLVPGRNRDDLLAELLLKQGHDLCFRAVTLRTQAGTEVLCFDQGDTYICLAESLSPEEAEAVACLMLQHKHDVDPGNTSACAYLLDAAFAGDDATKLNVVTALKEQGAFMKVNFI